MQPRGLTPDLNDTLNVQLRNALQPTQDALLLLGMPAKQALEEVTALFAHTVGLLVLSHTGRIRMFKQASQDLFGIYLEQLVGRTQKKATGLLRRGPDYRTATALYADLVGNFLEVCDLVDVHVAKHFIIVIVQPSNNFHLS